MKLFITAKPNSKENRVEMIDKTHYRVRVKAPPDEGRANKAILLVLAEHLDCPKSRLTILRGHKSKTKIIGFSV